MESAFRFQLIDLPAESRIRGIRSSRNSLVFVCTGGYSEGLERSAGNLHYHPAGDEQRADLGTTSPKLLGICFADGYENPSLTRWLSDRREPGIGMVTPTLLRIWREMSLPNPYPQVLDGLAYEVLGWLDPGRIEERQIPKWLWRAFERISSDPLGDHTLSSVAAEVSIDRTHLAREYRRRVGLSVGEHLRRLRVSRAWDLLRQGETIEAAALKTGFYDAAHLKRHFASSTGWEAGVLKSEFRN